MSNKNLQPYVSTYATLSHLYGTGSFLTVADWPSHHRTNVKVSRRLLHTAIPVTHRLIVPSDEHVLYLIKYLKSILE